MEEQVAIAFFLAPGFILVGLYILLLCPPFNINIPLILFLGSAFVVIGAVLFLVLLLYNNFPKR